MPTDKHQCVNNYFALKGVGRGFIVNEKGHMSAQKYIVIAVLKYQFVLHNCTQIISPIQII